MTDNRIRWQVWIAGWKRGATGGPSLHLGVADADFQAGYDAGRKAVLEAHAVAAERYDGTKLSPIQAAGDPAASIRH